MDKAGAADLDAHDASTNGSSALSSARILDSVADAVISQELEPLSPALLGNTISEWLIGSAMQTAIDEFCDDATDCNVGHGVAMAGAPQWRMDTTCILMTAPPLIKVQVHCSSAGNIFEEVTGPAGTGGGGGRQPASARAAAANFIFRECPIETSKRRFYMRTLLLFDVDGTLILSGKAGLRAMNRAFEDVAGVSPVVLHHAHQVGVARPGEGDRPRPAARRLPPRGLIRHDADRPALRHGDQPRVQPPPARGLPGAGGPTHLRVVCGRLRRLGDLRRGARRQYGNTLAEQHRYHGDFHRVDKPRVQQRSKQLAAAEEGGSKDNITCIVIQSLRTGRNRRSCWVTRTPSRLETAFGRQPLHFATVSARTWS